MTSRQRSSWNCLRGVAGGEEGRLDSLMPTSRAVDDPATTVFRVNYKADTLERVVLSLWNSATPTRQNHNRIRHGRAGRARHVGRRVCRCLGRGCRRRCGSAPPGSAGRPRAASSEGLSTNQQPWALRLPDLRGGLDSVPRRATRSRVERLGAASSDSEPRRARGRRRARAQAARGVRQAGRLLTDCWPIKLNRHRPSSSAAVGQLGAA